MSNMSVQTIPRKAVGTRTETAESNIEKAESNIESTEMKPSSDEPAKQQHWWKMGKTQPSSQTQPTQSWGQSERGWWKRGKESVQDQMSKHLANEFNGKRGYNGQWFRRPVKQESATFDHAAILESDEQGKYLYRNELGQVSHKYDDVVTYLSPTNSIPRRLVVQSTDYVWKNQLQTGDWRRSKLSGSVPLVLKMAEWALGPTNPNDAGKVSALGRADSAIRIFLIGLPLQFLLVFPATSTWEDDAVEDFYVEFPGYHWKWPKHAINPLDMRPAPDGSMPKSKVALSRTAIGTSLSSRKRLLRPRQLIVLRDGRWVLEPNADRRLSYLFISYANMHFHTDTSATGRRMVEDMAAFATVKAGKTAYWLDFRCRAPEDGPLLDSDVYRMCDVIRGSYRVVVMLQGDKPGLKQEWGSRMWTLPEALLAPGDSVYFCTPVEDSFKVQSMNKVEMTGSVWEDPDIDNEDGGPTRLLAEHFTGLLTLSRLEILANAIAALGERAFNNYQSHAKADVAYALMGLLHYRIEKDKDDTLFQAIARLSLANDNDNLIERMVCLFPDQRDPKRSTFEQLARPDLFQTHLWDIEPLCQVVGVADEDNTVLLDNCRAMHIRWKNFPRMNVKRHQGMKKLIAELFVRSGAWWFIFGMNLAITYAPFLTFPSFSERRLILALELLLGSFFAVGFLLSILGPFSVRRLYGGKVLQSSPKLIGFEGVMPLAKMEKMIFGNSSGRLTYEPSSTPFSYSYRDPRERVGLEPDWIKSGKPEDIAAVEEQIPKGHHIFTLVDTGTCTVSIFSAERPPTVALICGREGGMLRTILCSWTFKNDCLYKESVIRMQSNVYEAAKPKGWLKVCLGRT